MSKPAFVEMAEKDMNFEADRVIKGLCDYAEKNLIDCDFILETFLKAFHRKIKAEIPGREKETKEEKHTCSNCLHRNPVSDNEYRCFMRASLVTRLGSDTCKLWE